jgi:hypothetical protein
LLADNLRPNLGLESRSPEVEREPTKQQSGMLIAGGYARVTYLRSREFLEPFTTPLISALPLVAEVSDAAARRSDSSADSGAQSSRV